MKVLSILEQQSLFANVQVCHPGNGYRFEPHPVNRPINKRHVQVLINLFSVSDRFINPMLVIKDENYDPHTLYVIDGQHRLMAVKDLGLPFLYIDVTTAIAHEGNAPSKDVIRSFVDKFNIGVVAYTGKQVIASRTVSPIIEFYKEIASQTTISLYNQGKKTEVVSTVLEANYPSLSYLEQGLRITDYVRSKYTLMTPLDERNKNRMRFLMQYTVAVIDGMRGYKSQTLRDLASSYVYQNMKYKDTFPFEAFKEYLLEKSEGIDFQNKELYYHAMKHEDWLQEFVF